MLMVTRGENGVRLLPRLISGQDSVPQFTLREFRSIDENYNL